MEEKINKLNITRKYIAAGQVWWVDMEDEEVSKYGYEETRKTRSWLVLSSNAEAAYCVPFTHRINRDSNEPVISDGNHSHDSSLKSGYIRRLSMERFAEPGSSLAYTISRKSLRKAWAVVLNSLMAGEFEEDEMHRIVEDAFLYGEHANRSNYDNRVQPLSCSMGNLYCSARHLTEEAVARVKYINGLGYEPVYVDYNSLCNSENEDNDINDSDNTK